jgi:threonine dehydrogenase-like Zn-dependent dehydrogenase
VRQQRPEPIGKRAQLVGAAGPLAVGQLQANEPPSVRAVEAVDLRRRRRAIARSGAEEVLRRSEDDRAPQRELDGEDDNERARDRPSRWR